MRVSDNAGAGKSNGHRVARNRPRLTLQPVPATWITARETGGNSPGLRRHFRGWAMASHEVRTSTVAFRVRPVRHDS